MKTLPRLTYTFLFTACLLQACAAHSDDSGAGMVAAFLEAQSDDSPEVREKAVEQFRAVGDVNDDGQDDLVLVWTTQGPTYWSSNLSVFIHGKAGYDPAVTLPLEGLVETLDVRDGAVMLEQKTYAPDDARCCPTQSRVISYKLTGAGKLSPL